MWVSYSGRLFIVNLVSTLAKWRAPTLQRAKICAALRWLFTLSLGMLVDRVQGSGAKWEWGERWTPHCSSGAGNDWTHKSHARGPALRRLFTLSPSCEISPVSPLSKQLPARDKCSLSYCRLLPGYKCPELMNFLIVFFLFDVWYFKVNCLSCSSSKNT